MAPESKHVVDAALALPPQEREALAELLLSSLAEMEPVELSPEWTAELERRMKSVEDGTAELLDYEEVMARLRSKLERQSP